MVKILFVCLGNICRSPTAEGVFRHLLESRQWQHRVEVASAGTSGWHIGEAPDLRAQQEAWRRGIDLSGLRGRAVHGRDFEHYDYLIAMDGENLDAMQEVCPEAYLHKLYRFTDFAPELGVSDVPDPYYGGAHGFRDVFDIIEASAQGLLREVEADGFQGGRLLAKASVSKRTS
ncbi:MAG: low molecular weight phosphotyrosine protein phosphatase [Candidatus Hydrogenedentes bacterium]|nr:low molecular weight phosphotyrosine protein phosphatase [Candidatus Hydrogenedentota bacterium]